MVILESIKLSPYRNVSDFSLVTQTNKYGFINQSK